MSNFLNTVAVLLLCTLWLGAQNQGFEGYIQAGDTAVVKQNHYGAYRLYALAAEDGWSEDSKYEERLSEVLYKAGLAAYKSTAYGPAESYLLRLMARPDASSYELNKFYLAQSTFRQGRYDQAVAYYEQFLEEQPNADAQYRTIADRQINEADWAIDNMSRESDVQLRNLPEGLNTEDSEVLYVYGPKGSRYFSSNNFLWKKDELRPQRSLYRIMKRTGESTAEKLPGSINLENKNVAHAAFNVKMDRVYYSVCDFINYDEMRCDLFMAKVSANGDWTSPEKLSINEAQYSTGQPNVGMVDGEGKEYLFFSSDRPGGKGGLDLYRAPLDDNGTPGAIEHLSDLSTTEEDAAPYWYNKWQTLYFATSGRFSFGGLDVYKSFYVDGEFKQPINLGKPVNSAADDAYYSRYDDAAQAFVASRRATAESIYYSEEKDVCCYDLYEFVPDPRITLRALTFNKLTDEELEGVTVKLCEITEDGPVLIEEITSPNSNEFDFLVKPGLKYQLKAEKDGFTSAMDEFDLSDPIFEDVPYVERELYLAPKIDLDVFTFNNIDKKALPATTVSLYEITEGGDRILVEEITNPSANDSHFELEIGKQYQVVGRKPGFGVDTEYVDVRDPEKLDFTKPIRRDLYLGQTLDVYVIDAKTEEPLDNATVTLSPGEDPRTNTEGNDFHYIVNLDQDFNLTVTRPGYFPRDLDLRFTQADVERFDGKLAVTVPMVSNNINDFLDLRVYFDNDHPDPDAYRSTTKLAYDETYDDYIARREAFVESSAKGLSNDDAFVAKGAVNEFFDEQVIPGYEDLLKLADALVVHMQNGRSYEINLVGFASPRAPDSYNLRLSARRNVCLQNFFERFQDGALIPYLQDENLTFKTERRGEEKDLGAIYEVYEAERESIYSVEASLERRVEFPKIFTTNSRK